MEIEDGCVFCQKNEADYITENDLAVSFADLYPVSKGHTLIIPKHHVRQIWELTDVEQQFVWDLVNRTKKVLDKKYSPDGYNVVVNSGAAAGQSVFHCHVHLIPRYWESDPKRVPTPGQFAIPTKRPQFKGQD